MNTAARLALLAAAVVLLGGATALVLQGLEAGDGATDTYAVRITGPHGDLWNGTVQVADATAHDALLAAADRAGLDVHVVQYQTYPPCGLYVDRIGPHGADDDGGWVYEVLRGGEWQRPMVGACGFPLEAGDEVWWRYVAGA